MHPMLLPVLITLVHYLSMAMVQQTTQMSTLLMISEVSIIIGIIIRITAIINETMVMLVLINQITNVHFEVNVAYVTKLVIIRTIVSLLRNYFHVLSTWKIITLALANYVEFTK